eukprot:CAMPEP_0176278874 /NCGR_PEP_ID=MMETSP0121_2-20121125/49003_1 /TAXON_ID=160619 /ORGANISM="Kryptoperidinium foliaceum, Strain CCMP 1326" /LENGTH=75 /DNA_ID=CAMNT_0017619189 /DNA_START=19 /DNA_END=243 /DNA_ORIENTATION=+
MPVKPSGGMVSGPCAQGAVRAVLGQPGLETILVEHVPAREPPDVNVRIGDPLFEADTTTTPCFLGRRRLRQCLDK